MKQIVFVSGKGGTGKSTIVASLSLLVKNKMLADCDVDAPNLHLLIPGEQIQKKDYFGARTAQIDPAVCVNCGMCKQICRFDAIGDDYTIDPMACEGCAACRVLCPSDAISIISVKSGETYVTKTERGVLSYARLTIGAEGSGKLVTEVRRNLFEFMQGEDWVLIDGSPGIGCVVIASITGTDAVVAVAEPTQSGQHDLDRVLSVADHFRVPAYVCINKYDLNEEITRFIEIKCQERCVPIIGRIPYEPAIVQALQKNMTPVEANIQSVVEPIQNLWRNLSDEMKSGIYIPF